MTAIDTFITNLQAYRNSSESSPIIGDIDLFIAALQTMQAGLMQLATKQSTNPLTSGTLWTYTGGIRIISLFGIVKTQIQVQTTQTKLSIKNDALAAVDICSNGNISGATVGTLFHITDAAATALQQHQEGVDGNSNNLSVPIGAICTNSGIITVTYGATSLGLIDWFLLWESITVNATVI
jgi:hypothetical protein